MNTKPKHTIVLVFAFCAVLFLPLFAHAQHGLTKTADASTLSTYNQDVPTMLGTVIGAAMSLVGVVFFVLSIYAGFLWMTARGDETQAKKARDTLTMSVIGLIIVFGAYAITAFVTPKQKIMCDNVGDRLCTNKPVGFACAENKVCVTSDTPDPEEDIQFFSCDCS